MLKQVYFLAENFTSWFDIIDAPDATDGFTK